MNVALGCALSILSGLLLGLFQLAHWTTTVLGLVALVPLLFALERSTRTAHACLYAAFTTVVSVAISFFWLVTAASSYAHVPHAFGWLLLSLGAVFIEPQILLASTARHFAGRGSWRARGAFVGTYLVVEAVVPKLLGDSMGQALYPWRDLRMLASVGGVPLLTLLLLVTNELIHAAALDRKGMYGETAAPKRPWPIIAAMSVLLLAWVAGCMTWASTQRATSRSAGLRVAAVQAGPVRYDELLARGGAAALVEHVLSTHERLHRKAVRHTPELVVWGESIYPTTFGHPKSAAGADADAMLANVIARQSTPVLFGGYDADEAGTEYNAAFLVDAKGRARETYRKTRLFPFAEFIPFGEVWRRLGWIRGPAGWGRGSGPRVLTLALDSGRALRVQPLICYEALFAEMTRGTDADLLLTLSNDGWFESTTEARQHLVSAAFRSIETGRPQLRVANSGGSALIDARGDIVESLPWGAEGVLAVEIPNADAPDSSPRYVERVEIEPVQH